MESPRDSVVMSDKPLDNPAGPPQATSHDTANAGNTDATTEGAQTPGPGAPPFPAPTVATVPLPSQPRFAATGAEPATPPGPGNGITAATPTTPTPRTPFLRRTSVQITGAAGAAVLLLGVGFGTGWAASSSQTPAGGPAGWHHGGGRDGGWQNGGPGGPRHGDDSRGADSDSGADSDDGADGS